MSRFDRSRATISGDVFPERIEDYIDEGNPARAIDAFVDVLNLEELGFSGMATD